MVSTTTMFFNVYRVQRCDCDRHGRDYMWLHVVGVVDGKVWSLGEFTPPACGGTMILPIGGPNFEKNQNWSCLNQCFFTFHKFLNVNILILNYDYWNYLGHECSENIINV